jgi:predicted DNA-binding transcriptional regulator AlpA
MVPEYVEKLRATVAVERRRLNVEGAARYTGLSVSTLNKMRCRSSLGPPFLKLGHGRGRVVYDTAQLDEWLARHRKTSTSQYAA